MKNSSSHKDEKVTPQSSSAKSPTTATVKKEVVPTPADKSKKPVQPPSDNTMRQQKQQKQFQREPQQQPGGKIVNSDTPDAPPKEREQTYQSRPYQVQQLGEQQKQNQQQQSSPAMDVIKAKWQKHVGAAKVVWGKLTDDEILQSEGQVDKLSGLVRERYAISRYEADSQVKSFLDKCKS
jgi:uncharacterized protein YjbJ (UPF0337 family)